MSSGLMGSPVHPGEGGSGPGRSTVEAPYAYCIRPYCRHHCVPCKPPSLAGHVGDGDSAEEHQVL